MVCYSSYRQLVRPKYFKSNGTWGSVRLVYFVDFIDTAIDIAFYSGNLSAQKQVHLNFILTYFVLVWPIALFTIIADIPYFKFFHNRLTESAFQWLGSPKIVLNMILESNQNILFMLVAIALLFAVGFLLFRFTKNNFIPINWKKNLIKKSSQFIFLFLGIVLCFMGIRGKIDRPIRQGDAFFGNDPILNQVGLNPLFTLLKSYTDKVSLMDNQEAILSTINILGIKDNLANISPIAYQVNVKQELNKVNVVLVLMESMSANYMTRFGNPNNLTPTLDSLSKVSWFFENGYSAGIHTNNGVFSSLYSFPALKRIRPMSMVPARQYSGLPFALKQLGYQNLFFSSHNETFDNLATFISANHFDRLYSAKDYPADKLLGTFGVADDYLFGYAADKLDQTENKQPFFATILTTSNHEPYAVPEEFRSHKSEQDLRAVNYADWSIQQFLKRAQKSKWFNNTLFIFVADHGLVVGNNPYDLPLSYHHIPMIFYGPKILSEPKVLSEYIGQIDLYPTLMGILKYPYLNNTLGVDAIQNPRPCIYFSADNKAGCLNKDWLYVYRFDGGGESLYHYQNGDQKDYIKEEEKQKNFLKKYAFSQIQTAEFIFTNDLAKVPR
jgi:phosphoglycerol transferase MdoB-like AlkP superfamily enzyme